MRFAEGPAMTLSMALVLTEVMDPAVGIDVLVARLALIGGSEGQSGEDRPRPPRRDRRVTRDEIRARLETALAVRGC